MVPRSSRYAHRATMGVQQGAFNQKAALPQLVSFGLDKDTHLREAQRAGGIPTPLESPAKVETDLEFVASMMWRHRRRMREYREEAIAKIEELKR